MKRVAASDYYEVRKMGTVPSTAFHSLSDLYLPLVGPFAVSVYQCLIHDSSINEPNKVHPHGNLFSKLQMTAGQFEAAMRPLEAVGLVRTFSETTSSASYFIYCVYPPLLPEEFLSDVLFRGMLISYIGEEDVKKLDEQYSVGKIPTDLQECSETFLEFFHPDTYSSNNFRKPAAKAQKAMVNTGFDDNVFNDEFKKFGFNPAFVTQENRVIIAKLGALYDLSSETLAKIAVDSFQVNKLDMASFEKRCIYAIQFPAMTKNRERKSRETLETRRVKHIKMMDSTSPVRFLSYLQGGYRPSDSDIKMIRRLSIDIGLPDPCINALLSYVSEKEGGTLNSAYCEKVAASLVRAGCQTSRDVMDYFERGKKTSSFGKQSKAPNKFVPPKVSEDEEDAESLDSIMAKLKAQEEK